MIISLIIIFIEQSFFKKYNDYITNSDHSHIFNELVLNIWTK